MKGERLFQILGLVDADLIEEAVSASSPAASKRRLPWRGLAAIAACLALIVGAGLGGLLTQILHLRAALVPAGLLLAAALVMCREEEERP